jgi:PAS domain S-box-containing protein
MGETDLQSRAPAAQSEAGFRLLFEANPLPMWVYERESLRFLAVNEAALRHYGYSRAEFQRLTLLDIRPPEEVARFLDHWRDASVPRGGLSQGQWTHRTRDGQRIEVDVSVGEITFQGRAAMLAVARDVTEQNKMQAQLVQLQKMEAVSRLAGSLAHDFNNLLGVISGYADLLGREIARDDPRRRRIELMRSAIESGASLTRQLLVFSRRAESELRPVDLAAVASGLQPMIGRILGVDHELVTRLEAGAAMVKADKSQLEQVILNLALNARDAMAAGGKLILETGRVTLDEAFARTHIGAVPGRYAVLSVSDTGCGMDAATRARIFEPFFTTKPEGQGTGLGLATVYGIVKRCGGSITVYSEVGQGTTFKILLPLLETAAAATAAQAEVESAPSTAGGTILLVEDGDAMRAMMRELLETSGYTVLDAATPSSAETVLAAHQGPLDLLLTDVVLPGMRGPALADRIRNQRPEVKVLFMSGYTDETIAAQGLVDKDALFVQKPFNAVTLLRRVRAAIEARQGP